MTITPCRVCRLYKECDIRKEKLAAVRGLKLTAMQFKCDRMKDDLRAGMKAKVSFLYVVVGWEPEGVEDPGGPVCEQHTLDAVVMGWVGNKVRVYVPPDQPEGYLWGFRTHERINVIRVNPRQVTPTGESVTVCKYCGLPKNAKGPTAETWNCRLDGYGDPEDCKYPAEQAENVPEAPNA